MKLIAAVLACASCLTESSSVNDGDEASAMMQATRLHLPVAADGETEAESFDMLDDETKEAAVSLDSKGDASVDVEVKEDALEGLHGGSYGQNRFGGYAAGTALEYYRLWNQGWLSVKKDSSLAGDVAMMELQLLGSEEAATVFQAHSQDCQPDTAPELEFHESNKDEDGVQHFLFRAGTKFQYLAFQDKRLIHADPHICSMSLLQEGAGPVSGEDEMDDSGTSLAVHYQIRLSEIVRLCSDRSSRISAIAQGHSQSKLQRRPSLMAFLSIRLSQSMAVCTKSRVIMNSLGQVPQMPSSCSTSEVSMRRLATNL